MTFQPAFPLIGAAAAISLFSRFPHAALTAGGKEI